MPRQGPGHAVLEAMRQCNLTWANDESLTLQTPDGDPISLLEPDRERFLHQVKEMLRRHCWAELAARRGSFTELEGGLNKKWSRWHLDHSHGEMRKFAQVVMTGAQETTHSLWERGRRASWQCPFCTLPGAEDINHINWICPAWSRYRDELLIPHSEDDLMHWPMCFLQHGLVPNSILTEEGQPHTALDEGVITEVQTMLARIAQARTAAWEELQRMEERPSGFEERERQRRRLVLV